MAYADAEEERRYKKRWYEANKVKHLKNVKKRKDEHRGHLKEVANSYKKKCGICTEADPCCLEFHHLDPKEKELKIAIAIRNAWSETRLIKEILKCMVVCRNCHAKIHKHGIESLSQEGR